MNEEYKDINRRVALALGWSGLEDEEAYTTEAWPDGLPIGEAREGCISYSGWFGWKPGAGEGFDKKPVPDFYRDPAAADLVWLEAARRVWDVSVSAFTVPVGPEAGARIYRAEVNYCTGRSEFTRHHALCLAFLAADEAR